MSVLTGFIILFFFLSFLGVYGVFFVDPVVGCHGSSADYAQNFPIVKECES